MACACVRLPKQAFDRPATGCTPHLAIAWREVETLTTAIATVHKLIYYFLWVFLTLFYKSTGLISRQIQVGLTVTI